MQFETAIVKLYSYVTLQSAHTVAATLDSAKSGEDCFSCLTWNLMVLNLSDFLERLISLSLHY